MNRTVNRRVLLLAVVALLLGVMAAWYGASTVFAAGVAADANHTAGGLEPLPVIAAILGTAAVVWALCALAWQTGRVLQRRRR